MAERWVKSSFDKSKGGVEVAQTRSGYIVMRVGGNSAVHILSRPEWDAFCEGMNAGEFKDLPAAT